MKAKDFIMYAINNGESGRLPKNYLFGEQMFPDLEEIKGVLTDVQERYPEAYIVELTISKVKVIKD